MEASMNYFTRRENINEVKPEDHIHLLRRQSTLPQQDTTTLVEMGNDLDNSRPVSSLQNITLGQLTPHCAIAESALDKENMTSDNTKCGISGVQFSNKPCKNFELESNNKLVNSLAAPLNMNMRETFESHILSKNACQNILKDAGKQVSYVKFEAKPKRKQRVLSQVQMRSDEKISYLKQLKMTNEPNDRNYLSDYIILHYQKDCCQGKQNATAASLIPETKYESKIEDAHMETNDIDKHMHFQTVLSLFSPLEMTSGVKPVAESCSRQTSFTLPNEQLQEYVAQKNMKKTRDQCERETSKPPADLYQSYFNTYPNPDCDYRNTSTSALELHVEKVYYIETVKQGIKKYCCPYCQYKCSRKGNLKMHIEAIHQGIKKYCCPQCQYKCSQKGNLKTHIEAIHQGIKKYCCPQCQYTCSQKDKLKIHIEVIHQGIKKHCCPYCQCKCSHSSHLKRHIEAIHQGIKKYSCPHCPYKCSKTYDLKRHIEAIHQGIKKHSCPHCKVRCSRKSHLKQHIQAIHQGIKKHCCPYCQYKCSQSGNLKSHIKAIHQST